MLNNKSKCYCNKCERLILFEDLNGNEKEEFLNNNYCFICSDCINQEMNAEDLINETETEPFTIKERTDLNIKKVVGK